MKQISECRITFGKYRRGSDSVTVTDENLARLYGIEGDNVYILPRGEEAKSFAHAEALCRWLLSKHVGPDTLVEAVGGGSIGDSVGFACSVYKRGVRLLQLPTTLLAMVDSGIGGKTAIDLDGVKNVVGTYYFADTLIDTDFLNTLDEEQMHSGMGEIMKYGMLSDGIVTEDLCRTVRNCALFKQRICLEDPYCEGRRNMLNFGHTVGHAMELSLGLTHGVAVANGLYYETLLAERLGLCGAEYACKRERIRERFEIYPIDERVLGYTIQDKKNVGGKVGMVLPPDFGVTHLSLEETKEILLRS